jgi:hypothetical protein
MPASYVNVKNTVRPLTDTQIIGKSRVQKKNPHFFGTLSPLFSCIECQEGYVGTECDFILCKNGVPNNDKVTCKCEQPYTGKFCEELKTGDVYLYYNRAIYQWGPLGVISIIPLIMILFGCNALAKKHQQQKVEKALKEQFEVDVTSHMVKVLLKK